MRVVRPQGILDKNSGSDLLACIKSVIDEEAEDVWIDCELVTFMDSSGLGCIIQALKHVRLAGCEMHLCRVNWQLKAVLDLTSANRVLRVHDVVPWSS